MTLQGCDSFMFQCIQIHVGTESKNPMVFLATSRSHTFLHQKTSKNNQTTHSHHPCCFWNN